MSWFSELTHGRGPLMDALPVVATAVGAGVGVPGLGALVGVIGNGAQPIPPPPPPPPPTPWFAEPTTLVIGGLALAAVLIVAMD